MASGVQSWSKTAATNASSDSAINWAEGQAPSSVNDSARAMMASTAKFRDDINGSITTGGTSTAFTATSNQGFASESAMDGAKLALKFSAASGASPTLAVDSLTARALQTASGTAIPTGLIKSGSIWDVTFVNSIPAWIVHGVPNALPSDTPLPANSVVTASITDANVTLAKIVNTSGARLLGNPTGSAAAPSEISLGSGLSFVGSALTPTVSPSLIPNYISGLTLSTAGSSATMSIAAGVASDSTNTVLMNLASAIAKTTASWVVGNAQGGLDTGSIANSTWYHFYEIERVDTGIVDVIFSLSASSPALPTNYTIYRRIGAGKTNGSGQWTAFTQTGDQFIWAASVADASALATTASRVALTLTVPTGIVVNALFRVAFNNGGGGVITTLFTSLQENDQASVINGLLDVTAVSGGISNANLSRLTNTSAQIGVRSSSVGANNTINTYGWIDTRGKG